MIKIENLKKSYRDTVALNDVTIDIEPGKIYALLGSNGSGKSTLMKIIAGLAKPTSGNVSIEGETVGYATKAKVAYMPTEQFYFKYMTCKDVGAYYRDFFDDFDYDKYVRLLGEMKLDINKKTSEMSSGMAAKLKIAATLSRSAAIIMLDEPLNGIDIIARDTIINTIIANVAEDSTVIMSSHLVDELEKIVDSAIFIKQGELITYGNADELREQSGKSLVDMYREIFADQVD